MRYQITPTPPDRAPGAFFYPPAIEQGGPVVKRAAEVPTSLQSDHAQKGRPWTLRPVVDT